MKCTRKFIIYCRSSPLLIHKLPGNYPSSGSETVRTFLEQHVASDASSLCILKVNFLKSQSLFTEKVTLFFRNSSFRVLLLVVDMLQSSIESINHLKITIDEIEPLQLDSTTSTKTIILLLHFPPSMFSKGIYPTLFYHGWKHRYIDSLSQDTKFGVIDIEFWMKKCLCETPNSEHRSDHDSMLTRLLHLTESTLPLFIAGFKSNKFIFNEHIQDLLSHARHARLICEKFLEYHDIEVHYKYLNDAAQAAYERESTNSMKSHIGEKIKDTFVNFLTYIITFLYKEGALQLKTNGDEIIPDYVQKLIPYIPVPELTKVASQAPSFSLSAIKEKCCFQCPFSASIFYQIELLIGESVQRVRANMEEKSLPQSRVFRTLLIILQKEIQVSFNQCS